MNIQKDDDYTQISEPHSAELPMDEPLEEVKDHDSEHCSVEERDQVCHDQFQEAIKNAPIPSVQTSLKQPLLGGVCPLPNEEIPQSVGQIAQKMKQVRLGKNSKNYISENSDSDSMFQKINYSSSGWS